MRQKDEEELPALADATLRDSDFFRNVGQIWEILGIGESRHATLISKADHTAVS